MLVEGEIGREERDPSSENEGQARAAARDRREVVEVDVTVDAVETDGCRDLICDFAIPEIASAGALLCRLMPAFMMFALHFAGKAGELADFTCNCDLTGCAVDGRLARAGA
jgi:hypothetical protein